MSGLQLTGLQNIDLGFYLILYHFLFILPPNLLDV